MSEDEVARELGPHDVFTPEAVAGLDLPKKVPLVIHENGRKKVIGEAEVSLDSDGREMNISGVVTDPNYRALIQRGSVISLGTNPQEACVVQNYRPEFKGRIPVKITDPNFPEIGGSQ